MENKYELIYFLDINILYKTNKSIFITIIFKKIMKNSQSFRGPHFIYELIKMLIFYIKKTFLENHFNNKDK